MDRDQMIFTASLAIYRDITKRLFDMGSGVPEAYKNITQFATKYSVEQAKALVKEIEKGRTTF